MSLCICARVSPNIDQPSLLSGIFHTPRGLLYSHLIHPTPLPQQRVTGRSRKQPRKPSFCCLVLNMCKHGSPSGFPPRTIVPRWTFLLIAPSHLASSLGSRQGGAGVGLGVAGNGESKGCGTLLTAHPCLHRGLSQAPPLAALSI